MGGGKGPETDYLIGVDQKIPDWLMTRVFLGEVEAAIRSGIKSRFGILGFSTSDAIWACGFLFTVMLLGSVLVSSTILLQKLRVFCTRQLP